MTYTPTEQELIEMGFEKDYDNFECDDGNEHEIPFYTLDFTRADCIMYFQKEWYWGDISDEIKIPVESKSDIETLIKLFTK